jgi:hypothetical protein
LVRDTLLCALDGAERDVVRPHRRAISEARDWLARVECLLGALQADTAEPAVASEAAELLDSFGVTRGGHLPRSRPPSDCARRSPVR